MENLPAIIGGLSLLVGAIFTGIIGLGQRRTRLDLDTVDEVEDYRRWRPRVRRAIVELRDVLAEYGIPEPEDIDDMIQFPPPKILPRHLRQIEAVTADDDAT